MVVSNHHQILVSAETNLVQVRQSSNWKAKSKSHWGGTQFQKELEYVNKNKAENIKNKNIFFIKKDYKLKLETTLTSHQAINIKNTPNIA